MLWGQYEYVKQWGVSLNQLMSRRFWGWKYDSGPTEKDAILCEVKRDRVTSPEQREKIEIRNQLLLTMSASLGYLTIGLVRGFSSPGVPSMQELSPHLVPDDDAVSWV
ncbi:unnamed protein product, partial [Timema podura]|nr:unnamed protein product [Timema podura]